jgi:hypothetical protein
MVLKPGDRYKLLKFRHSYAKNWPLDPSMLLHKKNQSWQHSSMNAKINRETAPSYRTPCSNGRIHYSYTLYKTVQREEW